MFSDSELNYLSGLINRYKQEGYKYYLLHTVSSEDSDYNICLYLSKEQIIASSSDNFILPDLTLELHINTYDLSVNRDILFIEHGDIEVSSNEFVYTNSKLNYELINYPINPDLLVSSFDSSNSNTYSLVTIFLLCSIFLYLFIKSVLNIRRQVINI